MDKNCDFERILNDVRKRGLRVLDITPYNRADPKCQRYITCDGINVQWFNTQMPTDLKANILACRVRDWNHKIERLVRTNRGDAFIVAYTIESIANDGLNQYSKSSDFELNFELETSDPFPFTYSGRREYLLDMLSKQEIHFDKKENVSIAWVSSNCDAHNKREQFVKNLVKYIKIDSYGKCLQNRFFS
ncbi:hypothetical protein ACOME3_002416 [Neoechinorhynchus agilis]